MKNLSLILNVVLLALVGHLYYLNLKKPQAAEQSQVIVPPASQAGGVKIAWVNADTLNEKYEWLKQQEDALDKRMASISNNLDARQTALMKEYQALQQRAQTGNMSQAEFEKEMETLQKKEADLRNDAQRMDKNLEDERRKAMDEIYTKLEGKLKEISGQIGYDYILSYQRGRQILLASDSLEITKQVLQMLNAKEDKKQ